MRKIKAEEILLGDLISNPFGDEVGEAVLFAAVAVRVYRKPQCFKYLIIGLEGPSSIWFYKGNRVNLVYRVKK